MGEKFEKLEKEIGNLEKKLKIWKKVGKTLEIWGKNWKFDEKLLEFTKGFGIWKKLEV